MEATRAWARVRQLDLNTVKPQPASGGETDGVTRLLARFVLRFYECASLLNNATSMRREWDWLGLQSRYSNETTRFHFDHCRVFAVGAEHSRVLQSWAFSN
jgi:hypothetical protein